MTFVAGAAEKRAAESCRNRPGSIVYSRGASFRASLATEPMKTVQLAALTALLVLSPFTLAQDTKPHPKQEPQGGAAAEGMPKPGPQQAALAKAEGVWDATMEMTGRPPSKGRSEQKMVLGGFWLEDRFTGNFGGMSFEGRGMTGYDPIKGKYVGTWVDSMSPGVMVTEGTFDEKTRTLTMVGDGYDQTGAKVKHRMLTIHKDANTVVFEMYMTGADGKEMKTMTITYTRAGAPNGKDGKPAK